MRERLSAKKAARNLPTKKSNWRPLERDDFAEGVVLAFDQTLTKTGWVLLWNWRDQFEIQDGGLFKPLIPGALKGFEATFAKADIMGAFVAGAIRQQYPYVNAVVHEMPSVQGKRIESSLMAAREIRRAFALEQVRRMDLHAVLRMYGRQQAYSVITGNPHSPKKAMSEEVNRLFPITQRSTKRWNQDVHDAVGLALLHLYKTKQEE